MVPKPISPSASVVFTFQTMQYPPLVFRTCVPFLVMYPYILPDPAHAWTFSWLTELISTRKTVWVKRPCQLQRLMAG